MKREERPYSFAEELANAITHGVGLALSVVALGVMLVYAVIGQDPWRIVAVSIFGATLILLYLASTLYHSLPNPRLKPYLRILDHAAIYLLIAGTYTPFMLVCLRGPWGWTVFGIVWTAALAGIIFKLFCIGRWEFVTTLLYVVMGWTIVIALKPAIAATPTGAIILMLIGGLVYTGGVIFYLWERLPYNHAVWHLFVLGGSIAHFCAIFFFIACTTS